MNTFKKTIENALFEISAESIHALVSGSLNVNDWHNLSDRACSERLVLKKTQYEETYITETDGNGLVLKIDFKLSPLFLANNPNMFDLNIIKWSLVFPVIKGTDLEKEVKDINDYLALSKVEIGPLSIDAEENIEEVISILLS